MRFEQLKTQYQQLPKTVRLFIQRALLLFIAWKILYDGFLQAKGIPDKWLTRWTGEASSWLLTKWYQPAYTIMGKEKAYLYINQKLIVAIADGCNALELLITYLGFLICLPAGKLRFWLFAPLGLLSIVLLNILRTVAISWMNIKYPDWFDFAHHYLFQIIVYAYIFFLWVKYASPVYATKVDSQSKT